jgi:hypothetical protein
VSAESGRLYGNVTLPSPGQLRRLAVALELIDMEILLAIGVWAIARRRALLTSAGEVRAA